MQTTETENEKLSESIKETLERKRQRDREEERDIEIASRRLRPIYRPILANRIESLQYLENKSTMR